MGVLADGGAARLDGEGLELENAAVSGYDGCQEAATWDALREDPDLVVLQTCPNDLTVTPTVVRLPGDAARASGPEGAVVVDTPPVKKGGSLSGALLIAPTDGDDASANLIRTLRATPANTDIALVRIDPVSKREWEHDAAVIHDASNHAGALSYLSDPLPRTNEVRDAPNRGQPVWTLPRRGHTRELLAGVESLAGAARERINPGIALPTLAPASAAPSTSVGGTTVLDPARARAEADDAERRGAGTLGGAEPVEWDEVSVGAVDQPEIAPVVDDGAKAAHARPRRRPPAARGGGGDAAGRRVRARVDPAYYRRLQAMKQRLGLRTTAGAREYVSSAGLAVAERTARQ